MSNSYIEVLVMVCTVPAGEQDKLESTEVVFLVNKLNVPNI